MKYDKVNGKVGFIDSTHVYENLETKKRYTSVTTLINKYTQPFDKEFWSGYKAIEKILGKDFSTIKKELLKTKLIDDNLIKSLNIPLENYLEIQAKIQEDWIKENKKSTDRGTKIHSDLENAMYEASNNVSLKKYGIGGKFNVSTKYESFAKTDSGIYPEYLVYSDELGLAGQIDLLVKENNIINILDYKGLPLDTKIPTPEGFVTMENLQEGDIVYDMFGCPVKVLHKSETHNKPCIKFTLDTGEEIVSDFEHRWRITFCKSSGKQENSVLTSEEILKYLESDKNRMTTTIPRILTAESIYVPEKEVSIDPYVFGCWVSGGIYEDNDIYYLNNNLSPSFFKDSKYEFETKDNKNIIYKLEEDLIKNKLTTEKYIPIDYLRNSYEVMIQVLHGIMDSIGEYDQKRRKFIISFEKDSQISVDFYSLLSALGIRTNIYKLKTLDKYQFDSNGDNPFKNINKFAESVSTRNTYKKILNAEYVESVPTQCIEVEGSTHTYLCTEGHIVTHNTNKSIDTSSYYNPKTNTHQMMLYPLNTVQDSNYYHYALQLSTYAYMLQSLYPELEVGILKLVHFPYEGGEKYYDVPYLKDEVIRMITHFNKENSSTNRLKRITF